MTFVLVLHNSCIPLIVNSFMLGLIDLMVFLKKCNSLPVQEKISLSCFTLIDNDTMFHYVILYIYIIYFQIEFCSSGSFDQIETDERK